MMTSKDRVSQLVKAPFTGLAQIALRLGLSVVAPRFGDLWTVAIGAPDAIGPAQIADGGEPFGVVHERLQVNHRASIAPWLHPINERRPPKWADVVGDCSTPWNPY